MAEAWDDLPEHIRAARIGIFNTDRDSPFTSETFTRTFSRAGLRISMAGRWRSTG